MIKNTSKKRIFSAIFASIMAATSLSIPIWADEKQEHKVFPQISPTNTKVELNPGETYNGKFDVTNIGSETFDFKVYAEPYEEIGDNSDPSYGNATKYTQITEWITFGKEKYTIAPGEKVEISYTVKVPNNAPGGGQYAALITEARNERGSGGVQIEDVTRLAHLLYATINGNMNECAKILENNINSFMFEPPITATSLVENCGNVHQNITYTLKVFPLFSDTPIYSNDESPLTRTSLPETRRYNTISWTKEQGAPAMGIFNIEQTVKVGNNEIKTEKKLVFIFPLWLMILIGVFIFAVVFWLVFRSRQRKSSTRSSSSATDKSSNSEKSSD